MNRTSATDPILDEAALLAFGRAAKTRPVGLHLPEPMLEMMTAYAQEAGTTRTAVLREAVAVWLLAAQAITSPQHLAEEKPKAVAPNIVSALTVASLLEKLSTDSIEMPEHVQLLLHRAVARCMAEDGIATTAAQLFAAMQLDQEMQAGAAIAAEGAADSLADAAVEMLKGQS